MHGWPKQTIIHLSSGILRVNSDDANNFPTHHRKPMSDQYKITISAFLTITVIQRRHAVNMDLIVFIAQHSYVSIQVGGYAYAPASQRFRHFVRSMDGPPLVCISTISARLEVKDLSLCLSVMSTSSPCIHTSSEGMCWVCWRGSNACLVELLYWQAIVTASCNR